MAIGVAEASESGNLVFESVLEASVLEKGIQTVCAVSCMGRNPEGSTLSEVIANDIVMIRQSLKDDMSASESTMVISLVPGFL